MASVISYTENYRSNRQISSLARKAAQFLAMRDTVRHPDDIRVITIQREKIPKDSTGHETVQRVGLETVKRLSHTAFRFDLDASLAVQEDRSALADMSPELAARIAADPEIAPDDAIMIFRRDSEVPPHISSPTP